MGQVWQLIERHQDETPYRPSVRQIARAAGMNESTLPKWQNLSRMPEPEHLRAIARQINVPYRVLLEAALVDCGYVTDRMAEIQNSADVMRRVANRLPTGTGAEPVEPIRITVADVPVEEDLDQLEAAANRRKPRKP